MFSKATLKGDVLYGIRISDAAGCLIADVGTTCLNNPRKIVLQPNQKISGVAFKSWKGTGVLIDFQFVLSVENLIK